MAAARASFAASVQTILRTMHTFLSVLGLISLNSMKGKYTNGRRARALMGGEYLFGRFCDTMRVILLRIMERSTIMPANVRTLAESTREKLHSVILELEQFLNGHALPDLDKEDRDDTRSFYGGLLTDLRHTLVFSEVSFEKLGALLRRPNLDIEYTERALYEVYHHCVNAFFYPKNECYSEDGRYAYTGQDAIRFRMKPVRPARDVVLRAAGIYEELRDELSYYESDYMNQRRLHSQLNSSGRSR